jgi:hypothetical protein
MRTRNAACAVAVGVLLAAENVESLANFQVGVRGTHEKFSIRGHLSLP